MKRTIVALLALCLLLGLCACGNKKDATPDGNYIKVFLANGETETLGVGELPAMMQSDLDAYNEKYAENDMEMVTTITKIEWDYEMNAFVRVNFEGGWNCYIREDTPVLEELSNGLTVKVAGTLIRDGYTIYGTQITVLEQ